MLSARSIFQEIHASDEAYRLFLSLTSKGEYQGGWENERIAALTRDRELAGKIHRHGEDESKHGRLFSALLNKRGLEPVEIPLDMDYSMLLERAGLGVAHTRLEQDEPLSDEEIIEYLVHGRVTEQRGTEEIVQWREIYRDTPGLGNAVRMIADDEENHLAYCHEELLRFQGLGHGDTIRRMLEEYALVEIRVYRDVSLTVLSQLGEILGWSWLKRSLCAFGIRASYIVERLWTWRRMTGLRQPERRNAMAPQGDAPKPACESARPWVCPDSSRLQVP